MRTVISLCLASLLAATPFTQLAGGITPDPPVDERLVSLALADTDTVRAGRDSVTRARMSPAALLLAPGKAGLIRDSVPPLGPAPGRVSAVEKVAIGAGMAVRVLQDFGGAMTFLGRGITLRLGC